MFCYAFFNWKGISIQRLDLREERGIECEMRSKTTDQCKFWLVNALQKRPASIKLVWLHTSCLCCWLKRSLSSMNFLISWFLLSSASLAWPISDSFSSCHFLRSAWCFSVHSWGQTTLLTADLNFWSWKGLQTDFKKLPSGILEPEQLPVWLFWGHVTNLLGQCCSPHSPPTPFLLTSPILRRLKGHHFIQLS